MDKKQILKEGLNKIQKFLVISKDVNGKEHYCVFDNLELAKKYKSSSDRVQPITMYVEE